MVVESGSGALGVGVRVLGFWRRLGSWAWSKGEWHTVIIEILSLSVKDRSRFPLSAGNQTWARVHLASRSWPHPPSPSLGPPSPRYIPQPTAYPLPLPLPTNQTQGQCNRVPTGTTEAAKTAQMGSLSFGNFVGGLPGDSRCCHSYFHVYAGR